MLAMSPSEMVIIILTLRIGSFKNKNWKGSKYVIYRLYIYMIVYLENPKEKLKNYYKYLLEWLGRKLTL